MGDNGGLRSRISEIVHKYYLGNVHNLGMLMSDDVPEDEKERFASDFFRRYVAGIRGDNGHENYRKKGSLSVVGVAMMILSIFVLALFLGVKK